MSRIRQYLVATGTFSVALGIGFVMQNGDALASRFSEPQRPAVASDAAVGPALIQPDLSASVGTAAVPAQIMPVPDPVLEVAMTAVVLADEVSQPSMAVLDSAGHDLVLPDIDAVSGAIANPDAPATPPVLMAAVTATDLELPQIESPLAVIPACDVTMTATVGPAAMVDLALAAPCSPDTRVTIHHQGMIFSILTDSAGAAHISVPALAENAVFIADLSTGEGSVAVTTVPDLNDFDRAVLQWQGEVGPEIHALEFGASYADAGHVWHGASRNPDVALAGTGGFLVRLGDGAGLNPMMAEVYTYPSGQSRKAGIVAFTIETPVTDSNCGSEIQAQTIQISPGADAFALDLSMAIPDCNAVGEYLVLRNMLLDLTLAAK